MGIEGAIDVYLMEGGKPADGFIIDNEVIPLAIRNGKISPGFMENDIIRVPRGYSVLRADHNQKPKELENMLWALRRFARENPGLGIKISSIHEDVKQGLQSLYARQ